MHPSRIQNDTPCGQAASQHGHSYWKEWKSILQTKQNKKKGGGRQISTIYAVTRNISGHNWDVWLSCLYLHLTQTIHAIITHFTTSNLSKPSVCSLQNNTHVCARLKVLMMLLFSIQVFCDIMPHGWASVSWCSSSALKMWYAYHWCYADSRLVALKEI